MHAENMVLNVLRYALHYFHPTVSFSFSMTNKRVNTSATYGTNNDCCNIVRYGNICHRAAVSIVISSTRSRSGVSGVCGLRTITITCWGHGESRKRSRGWAGRGPGSRSGRRGGESGGETGRGRGQGVESKGGG